MYSFKAGDGVEYSDDSEIRLEIFYIFDTLMYLNLEGNLFGFGPAFREGIFVRVLF